ncbi:Uncharacterised protein [Nocardia africana]|uniref:Uncharacterized protein n=1 Tax=Nocardia africana TaxID=134964 RepID=A0A378WLW0_9NOCA|nr:Uncharacterised protein [Nocardia africana]
MAINLVLRSSYASTNSATTAFWVFLAFYVVCATVVWSIFLRRPGTRSARSDSGVVAEAEALVLEAERSPDTDSIQSTTSARA